VAALFDAEDDVSTQAVPADGEDRPMPLRFVAEGKGFVLLVVVRSTEPAGRPIIA
jgi:hypothetical protein